MTETSRKMLRKLSHADEVVTEAEMEMESLTAEINDFKQRLDEVMGQSQAYLHRFAYMYTYPHLPHSQFTLR